MGCRFSCCRASSPALKSIRVVHMNGYVEDFEHPVSVSQVTGKPAKHFVCTRAQLLSPSSKPLKPDSQLQLGHIYFLLPFSLLESSDASPMDLATAATRLTCHRQKHPL
ncbi:hypothetical protein L1049_000263 [Liquidambar formosana]|uniref:Uncharacterized protein n=1 Tax=Liquidambar formosana TaxID=63359 RepID=A0AAP0N8M9_LIQFO